MKSLLGMVAAALSGTLWAGESPGLVTAPGHVPGLSCRVILPSQAMAAPEELIHFNRERSPEQCYNALPLPASFQNLPAYFAPVGKERSHFVIPIVRDPAKHLQPGDLLVYYRDVAPQSTQLYEHLTKGRWHAAVVGADEKGLYHLDSPPRHSGTDFTSSLYHVLRLRPDLPQREERMKRLLRNIALLKRHIESRPDEIYDPWRVTEATLPEKIPQIRKAFERGECPPYRLYCSELYLTALVGAGLEPIRPQSLALNLERLETQVLPRLITQKRGDRELSPSEWESARQRVVSESIDDFFNDAQMLSEMGCSQTELYEFNESGKLPPAIQKMKRDLVLILSASREARPALLAAARYQDRKKGEVVGPSELMDDIFNPDGVLSYAFTYVGESTQPVPPPASVVGGGRMGNRARALSRLRNQPHYLADLTLHRHPITDWKVSPDGRYLLTGSQDQTARLLSLRTREAEVIFHSAPVRWVRFSPRSEWAVTASEKETIVTAVGGMTALRLPEGTEGVEFSTKGRFALLIKKVPPSTGILGGNQRETREFLLLDTQRLKEREYRGTVLPTRFPAELAQFSPDERLVFLSASLGGGGDGSLGGALFETATGKVRKQFADNKWAAFDTQGKYVFHTTQGHGVRRYQTDQLEKTPDRLSFPGFTSLPLPITTDWVLNLSRTPEGKLTLKSFSGKTVSLESMNSQGAPLLPDISPDRTWMVLAGDRGTLIYHLETAQSVQLKDTYYSVRFLPRGHFLAHRGVSAESWIIDGQTGEARVVPAELSTLSSDGSFALGSRPGGITTLYRLEDGQAELEFKLNAGLSGYEFFLGNDFVIQPDESDIAIFSKDLPDPELLQRRLREYDAQAYFGPEGENERQRRLILLKFLLERLKGEGLTRDGALQAMNSYLTHATYRGKDHILGIIDEAFSD